MRERHFMEDENELPFLVSETRESEPSRAYERSQRKSLDDIVASMRLMPSEEMRLKAKLVEFLNARDCTNLTVDGIGPYYVFAFTRENEYITTTNEFEYDTGLRVDRIFSDCFTTNNYDRLIANPRFQAMIRKTGMEFVNLSGGYECTYSLAKEEFTLDDRIRVNVHLKAGSEDRLYPLDLDRMELDEDYMKL